MPRHHNAEVVNRLRRFMGSRGPVAIDTIAPEIVPIVIAADAREQQAAALERYAMGFVSQGGIAAEYAHAVLLNPAGAQVDLIVDAAVVYGNSWIQFGFLGDVTGYTASDTGYVVDIPGVTGFNAGVTEPTGKLYSDSLGAIDTSSRQFGYLLCPSTGSFTVSLGVRLEPGMGFLMVNAAVNQLLRVTFYWREVERVP